MNAQGRYTWYGDAWDFEDNPDGTRRMPLDVLAKLMEIHPEKIEKNKMH